MTKNVGIGPCAVKTLQYASEDEQIIAEAELAALWDTFVLETVNTCVGVFLDTALDGTCRLQVALE